ncbi:leucine-rich repeat-containing protein, partial [Tanacetum coccineum]
MGADQRCVWFCGSVDEDCVFGSLSLLLHNGFMSGSCLYAAAGNVCGLWPKISSWLFKFEVIIWFGPSAISLGGSASRAKMVNSKLLYLFFLFFIHLCSVHSFNSKHECSHEQRDVLLLIKENISTFDNNQFTHPYYLSTGERYYGPQHDYCRGLLGYAGYHPLIRNWNTSTDCCQWDGVSCNNVTGDVIGLDLRCGMLKGVLELFTLFSRLPHLEVLDLSYNSLSVVTNNVTDNVNPNLHGLGLAYCELTVFPEFLRGMKNLGFLDLAGNNIHGLVPDWAGEVGGNKLVYLDLSDNFITGLSLFQWSGLEHLYLQSN